MKRASVREPLAIPPLYEIVKDKLVDGEWFAKNVPVPVLNEFERCWDLFHREGQDEPPGDWTVWMMLAGRGFGKTRTGAEWLRHIAVNGDEHTRLALVGATAHDARAVMVEGDSGMLATASDRDRPCWEPTLGRLIWGNGAQAYVYSAESPDRLRGPQFHAAWCDELAAWPEATAKKTWTNLRFTLRLGERPRLVATTTPRPTRFVREVIALPDTVVTGGRTFDNPVLAPSFLDTMIATYAGTSLGRQELDGELLEDRQRAMWTRQALDECCVDAAPPLVRVVVGVDPSVSGSRSDVRIEGAGDACGIVVTGVDRDGIAYVLEDATLSDTPYGWARTVARAAAVHRATCIVAEANNGGEMVRNVLLAADRSLAVKLVHASTGKSARAEPVSLLYERKLVRHVGTFPDLEDELCGFVTGAPYQGPGRSPDRADALVWALTELMLGKPEAVPGVRFL